MSDFEMYDEYDEYDGHDEPELIETSYNHRMEVQRWQGQLIARDIHVYGNRYRGQDWGEAEFHSTEEENPIENLKPIYQIAFFQAGKRLKEGEIREVSKYWLSDFIVKAKLAIKLAERI
ncbi:MAG: hypothetical protein KF716_23420 [Anaerolineae bacterium]|nr:hypothetical protein [Anaerolineae bacterium]